MPAVCDAPHPGVARLGGIVVWQGTGIHGTDRVGGYRESGFGEFNASPELGLGLGLGLENSMPLTIPTWLRRATWTQNISQPEKCLQHGSHGSQGYLA